MTILGRLVASIENVTNGNILIPHPTAVGNCAEQIYYGLLKARREGRRLLIGIQYPLPYPLRIRLTNRALLAVASDYRRAPANGRGHVLFNVAITFYGGLARLCNHLLLRLSGKRVSDIDFYPMIGHTTLWQPDEKTTDFSWRTVESYNWTEQIQQPLPVYLPPALKTAAADMRSRLGLPDDAWFACLHVRESGFHNDPESAERNASIANYVGVISAITGRGGWIVRMGDPSMTRLSPMPNVIDYPFRPEKSDLMDIYLISKCAVYIGMQSGIFDVAMLFQRPIILTNMVSWLYPYPQRPRDLGICKHVHSHSKGRRLSVREWMLESLDAQSFVGRINDDYRFEENSTDELTDLVEEFLEPERAEPTAAQRELAELRLAQGKRILDDRIIRDDDFSDIHQRYRLASRLESARGRIGRSFLERQWID